MAKRKTFLFCSRCGKASVHILLSSVSSDERRCSADGHVHHEPSTYFLFQCAGCIGISLYIWSALHQPESEFGECTYPLCESDNDAIPVKVALAYRDAEKVRFQSTNAYAVMVRRVLETIAEEQGIKTPNLFDAMSQLCSKSIMPSYVVEAIKWLRRLGNEGAHAGKTKLDGVDNEVIASSLSIVIQHFYIFPAQVQLFKYLLEPPDEAADF